MAFRPIEARTVVSVLQEHTEHTRRGLDTLGKDQPEMSATMRAAYLMACNSRRALDQALAAMNRELGYILDPGSKPKMTPPPGMEDAKANPLGEPNA